jgi:tetratricopeptide (TPR) repeat protein
LRALSIGYDLYFGIATPAERAEVRAEVAAYVANMTTSMSYEVWLHRPYVSNKSAMICAALGLAGISFAGEIDPALTAAAFARADALYAAWRNAHVADDGCYREGSLYATWSLRNLVYYFQARKRYDGTDFSDDWAVREIERWLAYEVDPRGGARLNNIQDQSDFFLPLARHTTYFEWAMSEWGSGLSRYLWDRASGPLGVDMGDENDKAATVLWHQDVASVNPGTILPESALWESRGLYYYRSGWPQGAASDDIAISFYSGEFRGGHAQEDQNQFTLTAYGEKLVVDHGAGSTAKQSEAHNIVRIDHERVSAAALVGGATAPPPEFFEELANAKRGMVLATLMLEDVVQAPTWEKWNEAVELLQQVLATTPAYARAQVLLAEALTGRGRAEVSAADLAAAEASFTAAVAAAPQSAAAHFELGSLLLSQGRAADAVEPLQRTLSLRPRYPRAHLLAGVACASCRAAAPASRVPEQAQSLTSRRIPGCPGAFLPSLFVVAAQASRRKTLTESPRAVFCGFHHRSAWRSPGCVLTSIF